MLNHRVVVRWSLGKFAACPVASALLPALLPTPLLTLLRVPRKFPERIVAIPLTCHPPTIRPSAPPESLKNARPRPNGSS